MAPVIGRRLERSRMQARGPSLTFEGEEAPPPHYDDLLIGGGSNGQLRGVNRHPSIVTLSPTRLLEL